MCRECAPVLDRDIPEISQYALRHLDILNDIGFQDSRSCGIVVRAMSFSCIVAKLLAKF